MSLHADYLYVNIIRSVKFHQGRYLRILFVAGVISLSLAATAAPASAHSELESSQPVAGTVLESSPPNIVLTFNQGVESSADSIRVYNEDAERMAPEVKPYMEGNKTVKLDLPTLDTGSYVVAWNVVSADSHPIRGGFTFSVKTEVKNTFTSDSELQKILDGEGSSSSVKTFSNMFRAITFLSLAMVIALIAMYLFVLSNQLNRQCVIWMYCALALCAVGSFGNIVVHSAESQLLTLSEALDFSVISNEAATHFGVVNMARIGLCVFLAFAWKWRENIVARYALGLGALALSLTPALSGHSRTGDFAILAVVNSVGHVLATSVWFGGLIILAFHLRKKFSLETAKKFSELALECIIVIAITGAFAWWRQVGSLEASFETSFGRLVNIKIVLFVGVLVVAFFSRRYVKQLGSDVPQETLKKHLVKAIYVEAFIILIIYGVTSVLVNTIPAKDALALPATEQVRTSEGYLEFIADPAKAGPGELHVYVLTPQGTPLKIDRDGATLEDPMITVTITNKELNVGPIVVPMRFQSLNHFSSLGLNIPFEGTWTITARVNLSEFDQTSASIDVDYR